MLLLLHLLQLLQLLLKIEKEETLKMTENQKIFRRVHGKIRAAMKEEINSGGVVTFSTWRQGIIDTARRQGLSETITAAAYDCVTDRIKARLLSRPQPIPQSCIL